MVEILFDVNKGVIVAGACYSDCLVPQFIDEINNIINTKTITYDQNGMRDLCTKLRFTFKDDENDALLQYANELEEWLVKEI